MKNLIKGNKKNIILVVLTIIFFTTITGVYEVRGDDAKNNIIILMDNSGSMKSGIGELAKVASTMTLDYLDEELFNVGIITFGEKVTILNNINENNNFEELKDRVKNIKFNEDYTNMKDGLEEAINQLKNQKGRKTIIILSDGVETAKNGLASDHKEKMNKLANEAEEVGIQVHGIALSDDVEREFLSSIATKTGGSLREGKVAEDLFEALTGIMGLETDFITVSNYNTIDKKNEKIKLSSMIESVVINVAAADNIQPEVDVKLDGKIIEPYKAGNLYYVYKFNNDASSELEIIQSKDMDTSVIIQLKSKAKINILGNNNSYISIPRNISREFKLLLDCGKNNIPEGAFIQKDGANLSPNKESGIFYDTYEGKELGLNTIRYTAKDGNGGIIAMAELNISINDYPPYDYSEDLANIDIRKGEKLTVEIVPKSNEKVNNLGGTLIVNKKSGHEEIPLTLKEDKLLCEIEVSDTEDIEFYAYIRGIKESNGSSFEYKLQSRSFNGKDRPAILLDIEKGEKSVVTAKKKAKIKINILPTSFIEKSTKVIILNKAKKEVGSFLVDSNSKKVEVEILCEDVTDNLKLYFKADGDVDVTPSLDSNIKVISKVKYIVDKFIKPISIIIVICLIILGIILGIYINSMNFYKRNVKEKKYIFKIKYILNPEGSSRSLSGTLDEENKKLFINYDDRKGVVTLDKNNLNSLGTFEVENIYENEIPCLQGFKGRFLNKDITKINFNPTGVKEIYQNKSKINKLPDELKGEEIELIYPRSKNRELIIKFEL